MDWTGGLMNILECSIFTKTQNKSQNIFNAMNNETHGQNTVQKHLQYISLVFYYTCIHPN